jgi:hypothetical protein
MSRTILNEVVDEMNRIWHGDYRETIQLLRQDPLDPDIIHIYHVTSINTVWYLGTIQDKDSLPRNVRDNIKPDQTTVVRMIHVHNFKDGDLNE